jgi:hypothetical protein
LPCVVKALRQITAGAGHAAIAATAIHHSSAGISLSAQAAG